MKSAMWLGVSALGLVLAGDPVLAQDRPPLTDFTVPTPGPRVVPQLTTTPQTMTPNQAQSPDANRCAKGDAAISSEARAAACAKLIETGKWKGKDIAWAYANRCVALDRMGKIEQAFADCVQALTLDPDNAAALQIRANILQGRGESDRALVDYDKAIGLGVSNAQIFSDRGNVLLARGEADKALADYDRAVELNGKNAAVYLDRGSAWLAKGDADKALADFNKAIEIAPNHVIAWTDRGDAFMAKGDKARAADDFKQALKLNPANAYAALWLFLARDGEADALTELRTHSANLAQNAWPWPVAQFYLGGKDAQAVLAAAKTPGDACEAQFYLGMERLLKKARDEALPYLRKAAETCPKNFAEYFQAVSELKRLAPASQIESAPKTEAAPIKDESPKAEAPKAEETPKPDAAKDSVAKPQQ